MVIFLVIIGISFLILIHEFGHFVAAKFFGLLVEEFGFGFPPRLFSKKIGETVYSINLLPFGGFVKIYGESSEKLNATSDMEKRAFYAQKAWKKSVIILAGVVMNFLIGWLIVSAVFAVGVPKTIIVTGVMSGTPAETAGLEVGDAITGFGVAEEFTSFVQENRGREITLNFLRQGGERSVKITPRLNIPEGQGALGIGFTEAGVDRQPISQSLISGLQTSFQIVAAIFTSLFSIILTLFTQGQLAGEFVGPIGIFGVASQAGALGLVYLLQLIGLISLNLFALNVFPFPALDGGRLLFIIIEKIKGSPLSAKAEQTANAAGFIFLLFLMIAITVRDVTRLF